MSTKIIAIRCKATGEFVSFKGKCAWQKEGSAKLAFSYHRSLLRQAKCFDDQDEYELVNLTEAYYRLEGLDK